MANRAFAAPQNRRRTSSFGRGVLLLSMFVGALAACGSASPTAPTPTPSPTVAPAPTVTGTWDLVFVEVPPTGVLTLTETAGTVTGTLQISGEAGSGTLSGTISADGRMSLTGTEPGGARTVLQVTVDAPRRLFTGSMQFPDDGVTLTVRGTRR